MIGVFDSGLGGLTILKEFLDKLPQYDYIYLGDNARAPYGNKSQDLIYKYTKEALGFLFQQGCELIIIACNTASAKALRRIQQEWLPRKYPNKKVLGVVVPAAEGVALKLEKNKSKNKIGLIGTRSTVLSNVYEKEFEKLGLSLDVFKRSCPLLVSLAEEGWKKRREVKMILRYYLRNLKNEKINILMLACTHYPFFQKEIQDIMGKNCQVFSPSAFVAGRLVDYLSRHEELEKKIARNKKRIFYSTDDPERFKELGKRFLDQDIQEIKKAEFG